MFEGTCKGHLVQLPAAFTEVRTCHSREMPVCSNSEHRKYLKYCVIYQPCHEKEASCWNYVYKTSCGMEQRNTVRNTEYCVKERLESLHTCQFRTEKTIIYPFFYFSAIKTCYCTMLSSMKNSTMLKKLCETFQPLSDFNWLFSVLWPLLLQLGSFKTSSTVRKIW